MKKYSLLLVALICMAFSCDPKETDTYHRKVSITNNADYPIYVAMEIERAGAEFPWNPDEGKAGGIGKSENRVNPGETNITAIATIRPSSSIEGLLLGRKMKVFFVDATMYDQIPIGDPLPDELLLDSRIYDLEALQAIDFHIHYPLD